MSDYANFMKIVITKKISVSFYDYDRIHDCSVTATKSLVENKEDPSVFTIPCTIGYYTLLSHCVIMVENIPHATIHL